MGQRWGKRFSNPTYCEGSEGKGMSITTNTSPAMGQKGAGAGGNLAPDDPRHGSPAGADAHRRAGEAPCTDCREAERLASKQHRQAVALGQTFTHPGALAYDQVKDWLRRGATQEEIAFHVGLDVNVIKHLVANRPELVLAKTHEPIRALAHTMPLTTLGATRRIQGLMWLGWSPAEIAAEAGVHYETVLDARFPRTNINIPTKVALAIAYDRLHLQMPPAGRTRAEKSARVRTRNFARKHKFVPPLGWNSIDDRTERPQGVSKGAF